MKRKKKTKITLQQTKSKYKIINTYKQKYGLFFSSNYMLFVIFFFLFCCNRIGGVMVNEIASSAVDRGFDPRSGQTKDYEIGLCFFSR